MIEYDPQVIASSAEGLIRHGREVQIVSTVNYTAGGLILGVIAGFLLALLPPASPWRDILTPGVVMLASSLILGSIGFVRGLEEARYLKFGAHQALCQLEIEKHLSELVARNEARD